MLLMGFSSIFMNGGSAQAAQQQRCFPETGFCISGAIRDYWEHNGGLPVFGYPISTVQTETIEGTWSGPVQWFERDRLEDHANEGQGVLAGRLGALRFEQIYGTDWQDLPRDNAVQNSCRFFGETQFNLCEPFLSYWQRNGGLARFGYPITRQRQENIEGHDYTVQYFERRRMEFHPENVAPYNVLLGLLGRDVRGATVSSGLSNYTSPDGAWSIQYPAGLLHPEDLGDGTIVFISNDRSTFAAVDSYIYPGSAFGNTGEELRNRARDTLARIYGRPVNETGIIQQPGGRWQTGVSFSTDKGSQGAAFYEQRGWQKGNNRVNGFLYGYRSASPMASSQVLAMRDSFTPLADAGQVLANFFSLLHDRRYAEAAQLYGGSYDVLRMWNSDVPRNDYQTLWDRGCTQEGLMCLHVRRVVNQQPASATATQFIVEFAFDDGELFQAEAQTQFPFTVDQQNGRYKVMTMPVYIP
jgi:hypothetical protein